mmetsp:Transcript_112894/g.258524  ORF Transcript_112894/g.258524 Transcript_112894/m.258524 type:complete len:544 (+) Transcript_112894:59-1690(+)
MASPRSLRLGAAVVVVACVLTAVLAWAGELPWTGAPDTPTHRALQYLTVAERRPPHSGVSTVDGHDDADLGRAREFARQGALDRAVAELRRRVREADAMEGEDAGEQMLRARNQLAGFLLSLGQAKPAADVLGPVLRVPLHSPQAMIQVAERLRLLGNAQREKGAFADAGELYESVMEVFPDLPAEDPRVDRLRMLTLADAGWAHSKTEELGAARGELEEALGMAEARGEKHWIPRIRARLGEVIQDQDDAESALGLYSEALRELTEQAKAPGVGLPAAFFHVLQNVAVAQHYAEDTPGALATLDRLTTLQRARRHWQGLQSEDMDNLEELASLGRALAFGAELMRGGDKQQKGKALRWIAESIAAQREANGGGDTADTADALNTMGNIQFDIGLPHDALYSYQAALRAYEGVGLLGKTLGAAAVHENLGTVLDASGDFVQAANVHLKALAVQRKMLPAGSPELVASVHRAAVLSVKAKRFTEGGTYLEEALSHRDKLSPAEIEALEVAQSAIEEFKRKRPQGKKDRAVLRETLRESGFSVAV